MMPRVVGSDEARFGLGRRVALAFGLVALLLLALGVVVSVQVGEMHTSMRRVLEEQREAGFSRDLVRELQTFDRHLASRSPETPLDARERVLLRQWIDGAAQAVDELSKGPKGEDPSSLEHEGTEDRLYASISADLERLRESVGAGALDVAGAATLRRTLAQAQVLRDEMRDEAYDSSRTLYRRARSLRAEVLWTTAVALAVLGLVLWMVRRSVVRPVERLREGVRRITGGELSHRVAVLSRDEIGELAHEFNRMASELQGMRQDLEARVDQRTQEFLRAARLAGLGTMAAGIAHEINNPLASIASCAEGLERKLRSGKLDPAQELEYLQIIAKEAYRAHDITSRLLEFARSEGTARLPFSLPDLLREIEVLLEHRLRDRGLSLQVRCDAALPPLEGNPSECKQVLLNLIHNAIDASPQGGTIRVACRREGGEVLLEVEDQGPGIPAQDLERIFDPFFTTKQPGQGTGLGLAIVHRIVEGHGGKIDASNTGGGALFRVRIPMPTMGAA